MDELTQIIMSNQGLVYEAMKYFKNYSNKDDLYQVGCMGIIKAYRNYQSDKGCKFSTYAFTYILGEMKKLVREDKGLKISSHISKLNLKIEKAYILLSQRLMRVPSIDEVANFLDIPSYLICEAINSTMTIRSIDEPINDEGKETTLQDIVGYSDNIDDLIYLRNSLAALNEEEKAIINNRYVNDLTQSETSKIMGISQVQVSRKEQKVLQKLKHKMAA
ncbi:MAG: sigma-70 family RNA polymerase sigma factor [Bacilli bacterium]|nr:sigma-70 family RNA polymerase sigma factor [Bacilli bacterium]